MLPVLVLLALTAACAKVGFQRVEVTNLDGGAGCAVRLPRPGMALGLGGVVKGWGVDRAVALLRARGLKDFWVQAGGDLYLCRPAMASRSATVVAKTATDAEFLSKAIFIAGGTEGLALAESFGADAVIVDAENRVHVTRNLQKRLQLSKLAPDARAAPRP